MSGFQLSHSVFRNMEAILQGGGNVMEGVYRTPLPPTCRQVRKERKRTIHDSLNLVNRRERKEKTLWNSEQKE